MCLFTIVMVAEQYHIHDEKLARKCILRRRLMFKISQCESALLPKLPHQNTGTLI